MWDSVLAWLNQDPIHSSAEPCGSATAVHEQGSPRAVVMLKSRHLQLVASLQQEVAQLKESNNEKDAYVKVLERKCTALNRQCEQLLRDHQQQMKAVWDTAKLQQECALGSLTYQHNGETARLSAKHRAELESKEGQVNANLASLQRTEQLLQDKQRRLQAYEAWHSTPELQGLLAQHPALHEQLLQLLQAAGQGKSATTGVCKDCQEEAGHGNAVAVPDVQEAEAVAVIGAAAAAEVALGERGTGVEVAGAEAAGAVVAATDRMEACVAPEATVMVFATRAEAEAGHAHHGAGAAGTTAEAQAADMRASEEEVQECEAGQRKPACSDSVQSVICLHEPHEQEGDEKSQQHADGMEGRVSVSEKVPCVNSSSSEYLQLTCGLDCPAQQPQAAACQAQPCNTSPLKTMQPMRRLRKVPVIATDLCSLMDVGRTADGNAAAVHVSIMHIPYSPNSPTAADSCSPSPRAVVISSPETSDDEEEQEEREIQRVLRAAAIGCASGARRWQPQPAGVACSVAGH